MPVTHRAFGLTWDVGFPFAPFHECHEPGSPDVVVREADVAPAGRDASWAGPLLGVEDRTVTFGMPGTARIRIADGRTIDVQRFDGCTDDALQLMVMGPASALLLQQRGFVPLHGSAFATAAGAVLVVGHSGAGKSTLLHALSDRGYPTICDDLAPVRYSDAAGPVVYPGSRVMKLWGDAMESLGRPTDTLPRVRPELEKFMVDLHDQKTAPMVLHTVYQLSPHNQPRVELTPLASAKKFQALLDHTWQKMTIKRMGLHGEHFQQITAIANEVRVVRVRRPDGVPIDRSGLVDALVRDLDR